MWFFSYVLYSALLSKIIELVKSWTHGTPSPTSNHRHIQTVTTIITSATKNNQPPIKHSVFDTNSAIHCPWTTARCRWYALNHREAEHVIQPRTTAPQAPHPSHEPLHSSLEPPRPKPPPTAAWCCRHAAQPPSQLCSRTLLRFKHCVLARVC